MKAEESYFKSHDHHRLYTQVWKPAGKSKGALIFVHGFGEHSGRYSNPIKYFSKEGYTLYLFDHRGHGRSDGVRSYVDNFFQYLEDLDQFTRIVAEKEEGRPLFMVGHSMGGQIVINYLAQFQTPLDGVILSSPNVQVAVHIPCYKKFLSTFLSRFVPRLAITNELDPKWISHDAEVVRNYKRDPLVSKKITLRLASEMLSNQDEIHKLAAKIDLPILLMQAGDDHICSPKASIKFFDGIKSKDKTFRMFEGFYHELFNEVEKAKVFAEMDKWLDKRLYA